MKTCRRCKNTKTYDDFYFGSLICRECKNKQKTEKRNEDREAFNAKRREAYAKKKDELNARRRERWANDQDYREKHKEWTENSKPTRRARRKKPENRKKEAAYKRKWYKKPENRLRAIVSVSIRDGLLGDKQGSCWAHLPYTPQQLKEHLESQFEPWMTWDNYGKIDAEKRTWNIDHLKPQASFCYNDYEDEDFQKCWALENLRPLEALENIKKGCL